MWHPRTLAPLFEKGGSTILPLLSWRLPAPITTVCVLECPRSPQVETRRGEPQKYQNAEEATKSIPIYQADKRPSAGMRFTDWARMMERRKNLPVIAQGLGTHKL